MQTPFFPDRRDQGDRQRRKMTAPGDATSLVVLNLRPGTYGDDIFLYDPIFSRDFFLNYSEKRLQNLLIKDVFRGHNWLEKFKKSRPKTSSNEINQFHEKKKFPPI